MTDYPEQTIDAGRWQAFQNVGKDAIPAFAMLGPQLTDDGKGYEAIVGGDSEEIDNVLRLGRPSSSFSGGQDAALLYVNGPQAVEPGRFGRCTQDGPMQALVGYHKGSPPSWNEYLGTDLFDYYGGKTSFALTPNAAGGYRLVSFNGCPETEYKDSKRPDYEYRVAWVIPAYKDSVPGGLVFRMGSGASVVEAKSIVTFDSALGPQYEWFGPTDRILDPTDGAAIDRGYGFFKMPNQGQYLLNFSAAIRSMDAPIAGAYTLGLYARTGRYGERPGDTLNRSQIEELREVLNEGAYYPRYNNRHQLLAATLGLQPADTNLYHEEVDGYITQRTSQVVARHWFTVSGSMVLDIYAGDTFFFYNPTVYQIDIENFSATLTLLPGTPSFSTRSNLEGRTQ